MPPQNMPHSPDPTKSSKTWAIAIIASTILLLAAAGVVAWLFISRSGTQGTAAASKPTDDVANVKNVSLIPPQGLPPSYVKNDQSTRDATQVYYYDDATNCGITVGVAAIPAGKTAKDTVTGAITAAAAQGVTTATMADGEQQAFKDADNPAKTYDFTSLTLAQDVNVQRVDFTKQQNIVLYKQFGSKVASLGYACKDATWAEKKAELAAWTGAFTVKTER